MSVDRVSNCTSSPNPQWLTDATQPTAFSSCYISPTNIRPLRYLSLEHRLHPRRLWARVFQTTSFRASRTGPASVKVCKLAFRCFATRFAQQQWRNRRYRDSFESVKRKLASGKKKTTATYSSAVTVTTLIHYLLFWSFTVREADRPE